MSLPKSKIPIRGIHTHRESAARKARIPSAPFAPRHRHDVRIFAACSGVKHLRRQRHAEIPERRPLVASVFRGIRLEHVSTTRRTPKFTRGAANVGLVYVVLFAREEERRRLGRRRRRDDPRERRKHHHHHNTQYQ